MQVDDPPYLKVGTEVSAKYKGAFCEAKVRKVVKQVKARISFRANSGTQLVTDDCVRGHLHVGACVQVKHPDKCGQYCQATIVKLIDCSQYTVVFDDGDIVTLRRSALCLKSGRHFTEAESLDHLPLTHPEHFSNPVRGTRKRHYSQQSSDTPPPLTDCDVTAAREQHETQGTHAQPSSGSSHTDGLPESAQCQQPQQPAAGTVQPQPQAGEVGAGRDPEGWSGAETGSGSPLVRVGDVVCVDIQNTRRNKSNWFPGLVLCPSSQIDVSADCLVRSFQDGRFYTVPISDTRQFDRDMNTSSSMKNHSLKQALQKVAAYLDRGQLPIHWDRQSLFNQQNSSVLHSSPLVDKEEDHKQQDLSRVYGEIQESDQDEDKTITSIAETEMKAVVPLETAIKADEVTLSEDKALQFGDQRPQEEAENVQEEQDEDVRQSGESKDHFVACLYKFMEDRGTPINREPCIGSRHLDLHMLRTVVHEMGGFVEVTAHNLWKNVALKMSRSSGHSISSQCYKLAYKRYLIHFDEFYSKLGASLLATHAHTNHVPSPHTLRPAHSYCRRRRTRINHCRPVRAARLRYPADHRLDHSPPTAEGACLVGRDECCTSISAVSAVSAALSHTHTGAHTTWTRGVGSRVSAVPVTAHSSHQHNSTHAVTDKQTRLRSPPPVAAAAVCNGVIVCGAHTSTAAVSTCAARLRITEEAPIHQRCHGMDSTCRSTEAHSRQRSPCPSSEVASDGCRSKPAVFSTACTVSSRETRDHLQQYLPDNVDIIVGDRVSVLYKINDRDEKIIYEAKVLQVDRDNVSSTQSLSNSSSCCSTRSLCRERYFIHYLKWNKRYDEWATRSRILENLSWSSRAKSASSFVPDVRQSPGASDKQSALTCVSAAHTSAHCTHTSVTVSHGVTAVSPLVSMATPCRPDVLPPSAAMATADLPCTLVICTCTVSLRSHMPPITTMSHISVSSAISAGSSIIPESSGVSESTAVVATKPDVSVEESSETNYSQSDRLNKPIRICRQYSTESESIDSDSVSRGNSTDNQELTDIQVSDVSDVSIKHEKLVLQFSDGNSAIESDENLITEEKKNPIHQPFVESTHTKLSSLPCELSNLCGSTVQTVEQSNTDVHSAELNIYDFNASCEDSPDTALVPSSVKVTNQPNKRVSCLHMPAGNKRARLQSEMTGDAIKAGDTCTVASVANISPNCRTEALHNSVETAVINLDGKSGDADGDSADTPQCGGGREVGRPGKCEVDECLRVEDDKPEERDEVEGVEVGHVKKCARVCDNVERSSKRQRSSRVHRGCAKQKQRKVSAANSCKDQVSESNDADLLLLSLMSQGTYREDMCDKLNEFGAADKRIEVIVRTLELVKERYADIKSEAMRLYRRIKRLRKRSFDVIASRSANTPSILSPTHSSHSSTLEGVEHVKQIRQSFVAQ